jgi:asparagine synthase (glutamine-hydrolysing)
MVGPADLRAMPFWFVVLADCESTRVVGAAFRDHATQVISHPSGRPWLLGRWPEGMVTAGQTGQTRIALVGQHAETADRLAEAASRIRTVADLDQLAASLVGSFHLVASVAGRVRVQGTITGVRRVFHAEVDGVIAPTCWPPYWARV